MINPNLSPFLIQLDDLYSARQTLNDQLNIIKDMNRNPSNRTLPNAFVALVIYNRLQTVHAQIVQFEDLRARVPIFFEEMN